MYFKGGKEFHCKIYWDELWPKQNIFFHRHTCHAFFALSSENICPMYCFGHGSSQSVLQWNSFFPLKYIVYKCFSCFRPRMGQFFHRHTCLHLSTLVALFFALSLENICPMYCFGHSSSQSVSQWNFFFSFKIHCLQMFQLFQTRDGPFFFIIRLVYTCHAFFALSSENIYPIYCFGHSSSQSVLQWNSFSPLKYIVYKCFSCFRPGMGQFFFIVTLVYTCHAFFAASSENICPIYIWLHHQDFWRENISLYNILYLSL